MVEVVTLVGGPLDGRRVQWPLDRRRRPWDQMVFCYLPDDALSSMTLVEGGEPSGAPPEPRRASYQIGNFGKATFLR